MDIYKKALLKWQREYFTRAILECDGSMIEAARLCGLNRTHFYSICDRVGIKRMDQRVRKPAPVNKGNEAWQKLGREEHVS